MQTSMSVRRVLHLNFAKVEGGASVDVWYKNCWQTWSSSSRATVVACTEVQLWLQLGCHLWHNVVVVLAGASCLAQTQ